MSRSAIRFVVKVVLATCGLGVAMDLVTAHVAVEYFTIHHPHVVDSDSPIVMALVWGIGASWWFGLIAGTVLWWYNRRLAHPAPGGTLFAWVTRALIWLWAVLMAILVTVYLLVGFTPVDMRRPQFETDRRLVAVALTHSTEYVLGAGVLFLLMWKCRQQSRALGIC